MECKEKYVFDSTVIHGHPGNEVVRGWILKSVLEEEERYRKNVETEARELYYAKWQNCFANAKTKKEIWKALTLNGKYYPSLGTFYSHTKNYGKEELIREIDRYFDYDGLKRVFEVCRIEPDWEHLGVNDEDRKRFRPENLISPDDGFKLKIELVPSTSWYNNLRKYTTKDDWDKIRKKAYADYRYKCGICGASGRVNCHEIWEYDDKKQVQKLIGFIALCDMCHHVKHIGLAGILSSKGELDYEKVIEHFIKVNNCDRKTFEEHRKRAFKEWRERSQYQWHIDLGEYKIIIQPIEVKSG